MLDAHLTDPVLTLLLIFMNAASVELKQNGVKFNPVINKTTE